MSLANVGLAVFVAAVLLNVGGLALDGLLWLLDLTTITERVVEDPWLGLPVVALQLAGMCGLVAHFYARAV